MLSARLLAFSIVSASCVGCTLVSLDELQSSGTGGASTTSSTSKGVTGSTGVTSTSSTATTSTGGGCTSFCADKLAAESCADFDSPGHLIGDAWKVHLDLLGGTTGNITSTTQQAKSCTNAARIELDGMTGGFSWVQLSHDVTLGASKHATFTGSIYRTTQQPASLDGSGFELEYDGFGVLCQLFVHLFDGPPTGNIFIQSVAGNNVVGIDQSSLALASPSANRWVTIETEVDWSVDPPVATLRADGATTTVTLSSQCSKRPTLVHARFGIPYDDRTQSLLVDDLLSTVQ